MGPSIAQMVLYTLGGCVVGAVCAWLIQAAYGKRQFGRLKAEAQSKLDTVAAQRDEFANKYSRSRSKIEHVQATSSKRKAALKSAIEKSKLLANNVRTLRTERENTKVKVSTIQNALTSLRQQTTALQTEFDKTREFYKRELLKSLQRRKDLEEQIKSARAEQESFARKLESSVLEHGSEEDMIVAAQLRLGQLEVLERTVSKLEGENAQLREDAKQHKKDFSARARDLREMEELRMHNRQLVQCVEALENSRKSHEEDAERYREQADQSEKLSDTLRLKLDDLEKNFAEMEKEQNDALEDARKAAVVPILRKQG